MKDIIKKNPVSNPTFGTDPSNPWATKYNVTEATETELLARYLNSRGVNPRFVTRDTKIAHAKSSEYAKWKADHIERFAREETEVKEDHVAIAMGKQLDDEGSMILNQLDQITRCVEMLKPVIKKPDMQVPAWVQSKVTLATDYIDTVANYMTSNNEKVNEAKKPKLTALDKWRKAADEREKKHNEFEKKQSKDGSGMTASIDRLEKQLNKEETINEVSKSEVDHHFNQWSNSEHAPYNSDAGDDNKVHQSALSYLSSTNVPKEKHEKLAMHIAHKFHGSGIDEEVEQIDELKKSTVFSWLKQQPVVPEKKPGMSRKDFNKKIKTHSKSWNRALDRLAGYKPTSEETENVSEVFSTGVQGHVSQATLDSIKNKRNVKVNLGTPSYSPKPKTLAKKPSKKASFISRLLNKEDTWQDSYAATQTTGMEIVDLPADEKYNKRKEMSKSARMIKSLYKNKGVKEGVDGQSGGGIMYDKEKTDKLETPYGKKPSMTRADKKMATGDKEPQAAAVLTGGKTLTGQDRDTLEIDPLMRKPGPLDQNKKT